LGDAPNAQTKSTIDALKEVTEEIKKIRKPTGAKDAPGKTCRDIAASADEVPRNGLYWVDPNGGGIADAFEAFCRFSDQELDKTQTCLVPERVKYMKSTWFRRSPARQDHAMFAQNFAEKEEFTYHTDRSQIKFLQKLTNKARQVITVACKNVVVVHNKANNTYDDAVKLISFDEEDMGIHGKKNFRYRVGSDGCSTKTGEWGETVLEIRARDQRMYRIPILDIGFKDVAASDQEFGIEVGRACFSNN